MRERAGERRLEVLLSLLLGVDGVEDGLSLGLVALQQLFDLGVHVRLEPRQPLLQVLVAQVLQLSQRARRTADRLTSSKCCIHDGRKYMYLGLIVLNQNPSKTPNIYGNDAKIYTLQTSQ